MKLNFTRNYWILSEFYSQIWVDFSMLKRTFLGDFDFIWPYFDLILLVPQLLSLILWFIWDSYWFEENIQRMIRAWRSFCHLNSQSRDFYWCWLNELLVLLYLVHSDWFILIYLIDFVDFHWYFEADRLTIFCQSERMCCIYTVKLTVYIVWLTLAQSSFKTPKNLRF